MPRYLIGETLAAPTDRQGLLYCHTIDEAATAALLESGDDSRAGSVTVCGRTYGATPLAATQGAPCPDC